MDKNIQHFENQSIPIPPKNITVDEKKFDQLEILILSNDIKNGINTISNRVLSGEIKILDSALEMGKLTQESMNRVANAFASSLNVKVSELPFAIFLFGAFTRNLMLPNSDLDIGFVFENSCPQNIKSLLIQTISSLPFADEVDIAHWDSIDSMLKENCPSLMEQNKAVEARFVVGNTSIAEQHSTLVNNCDTRKEKEKRFITEYWLLHKFDFDNRSSEMGMNLKYDFGASKDIAFLDWYYLLNSIGEIPSTDTSTAIQCFDILLQKNEITTEEFEDFKSKLELILLVKFSLWEENRKSNDKSLLYLNDSSLETCFNSITSLLKNKGINNVKELKGQYLVAKKKLHQIVVRLVNDVSSSNEDSTQLWNKAKEKMTLDDEVKKILENPTWHELVPFAIQSKSSEILDYIVKKFSNKEGFEYILRIISQNKYITKEIEQDLLFSKLDERFKAKIRNK